MICAEKGNQNTKARTKFRVLMLDKREYRKFSIEKSTGRTRLKAIQQIVNKKVGEVKLTKVAKNSFETFSLGLLHFERKIKDESRTNKFGVLYAKEGQSDEDSIYGNENGSVFFKEFLSLIGIHIFIQKNKKKL